MRHWEVEVHTRDRSWDDEARRVEAQARLLGLPALTVERSARVYLVSECDEATVRRLAHEVLTDHAIERFTIVPAGDCQVTGLVLTVVYRPGVMDPVAASVQEVASVLGLPLGSVRTGRRYYFAAHVAEATIRDLATRALANEVIELIYFGALPRQVWAAWGTPYRFRLVTVPLRSLDDAGLEELSQKGQLYLGLAEMQTLRAYYQRLGRDPTDIELETFAQTWSEHCSHKTLKGPIEFTGPDGRTQRYDNLLRETIFAATREIRRRRGPLDWCVRVFDDNAGIVRFDDRYHVCFKVETHNHPSALEPYGGASTGLGGVIRDVLGTGLGGRPVCNLDIFCLAPPDWPGHALPKGVLHPRRVLAGVVAGVRDYGNRMGIPTVAGALCFHERYLANPLVFCGTVGILPADCAHKAPQPGDLIVVVGGRTGRDGIHGATFSSAQLTHRSEEVSGGAVQIGNAIMEKKMLDVLLVARDRKLYHAITDCGAGGFSSAIGEMAVGLGAEVHLDRAPLKYQGLSYCEIWISESQERMILAVPPESWPALQRVCAEEDVEATVLGEFQKTGRLRLYYQGHQVADIDVHFLHEGRPQIARRAHWRPEHTPLAPPVPGAGRTPRTTQEWTDLLHRLLSAWDICSKEWVIRQYDHEVQGATVLKPLVGADCSGPSDAAVILPVYGSYRGLAVGCGIKPRYGDLDPYWMAASAIDEALRNVVAVGADPERIALLDNFCWGNTDRPEVLGSLVRAAQACHDLALALDTPFISGKDSLHNEFHAEEIHVTIPPTLLISALGIVEDARRCVSMDFKRPGSAIYIVGVTHDELGGSTYAALAGKTGKVPEVDAAQARKIFCALHDAIKQGLLLACHDLSEGGLAVALAEMCIAGNLGAEVRIAVCRAPAVWTTSDPEAILFSESNSRFLIEVAREQAPEWERWAARTLGHLWAPLGQVVETPTLKLWLDEELFLDSAVSDLKRAWQTPLGW